MNGDESPAPRCWSATKQLSFMLERRREYRRPSRVVLCASSEVYEPATVAFKRLSLRIRRSRTTRRPVFPSFRSSDTLDGAQK